MVVETTPGVTESVRCVEVNGKTLPAYFSPSPNGGEILPELAAYRLDRMLGLGKGTIGALIEHQGGHGVSQRVATATSIARQSRQANVLADKLGHPLQG